MNKSILFIIVLQVISLPVSAQNISSVENSFGLAENGNFIETIAANIGLAPSSEPNGPYTGTEGSSVSFDGSKSSTTTARIADKNKKPEADFKRAPRIGLEPLNVTFKDDSKSYDGITSWKWDFNNDGIIDSTVQNPTHEYAAGTYTVALTVCETDGDCDTRTRTDYITVTKGKLAPSSEPNGPYTGTEGSSVSFDGSKSFDPDGSIISYSWNFGDGNSSNVKNPMHTYIRNGTYSVSLEVTDNDGLKATNTTNAVIADKADKNIKPEADFTAAPLIGMEPLNVTFTDISNPSGGIASWKWDFNNDGITDSTVQNPTHEYAAGTYTVALTVCETDGDCNTKTRTDYITVTKGKLAPSSEPNGPYTGTEGSSVSFDGSKSFDPDGSIISYSWNFGDGNSSNVKNPMHTYIRNGTYSVSLEVTDNDGLKATNITTAVIADKADKKPLSDFTGTPLTGMEPLNVTFTDISNPSGGIASWKWDFNNDGITDSTIQNPTHEYAAGNYTVALTVCETDGDCDTKTRTDYITVTKGKLAPSSEPNGPYTGTEGSSVSFDGSKSFDPDGSIISYSWNFGDGNSSNVKNPMHTYIRNGTYSVSLEVTDNDGLNATNTTTATIANKNKTLAIDFTGTPTSGLEPLNVTFTDISNSSGGIASWKWDFNNDGITDSTVHNPTHEYAAGNYTVALTVCETDGDCDTRTRTDYIKAEAIIAIIYPANGQVFTTSSTRVSGTIYNTIAQSKIEVRVGSGSWVMASGNTSWTVPSMNLSAGSNNITARATDNSNNTYETSVNVTYSLPDNAPINSGGGGGGGSSGGGGGGGLSGENVSNIELIEKYDLPIYRNVTTFYRFTHVKNPIMFVNITSNTTMDIITASGEVLKGTSTLVKTPPQGLVYKNINIWVGTSGFATSRNIKEASIKFRVDNNWMSANSVNSSDIVLVKWNGDSWIELETRVLSKDDTNTFFEGKTIAFSPFAITTKEGRVKSIDKVSGREIPQQSKVKAPDRDEKSSHPGETAITNTTRIASAGISTWSTILILLIMNIIVVAMYFKWVKK